MGLDFSKTTTAAAPAATVVPDTKDEIAVVEQYDIVADREKMNSELVNSDDDKLMNWRLGILKEHGLGLKWLKKIKTKK